jgi:hypothetical protein
MSHFRNRDDAQRAVGGSIFELRLSSAVVCGLSAVALQAAALERAPFCTVPLEEAQASSSPDQDGDIPAPFVATRRAQAQLGNSPPCGGQPAVGATLPDNPAVAGPTARESAFVAAALAASRRLAAHPLRGPPRLPS